MTNSRLFAAILLALTTLNCFAASKSSLTPIGNNTFVIVREAKTGFDRDTERLKTLAKEDAVTYCESQHKLLKVVELTAEKPFFAMGYAKAKIVFKALDPTDPELVAVNAGPPGTAARQESRTDSLYEELIKLDDLRKKGILTEEEFQSEKQKILNRSK